MWPQSEIYMADIIENPLKRELGYHWTYTPKEIRRCPDTGNDNWNCSIMLDEQVFQARELNAVYLSQDAVPFPELKLNYNKQSVKDLMMLTNRQLDDVVQNFCEQFAKMTGESGSVIAIAKRDALKRIKSGEAADLDAFKCPKLSSARIHDIIFSQEPLKTIVGLINQENGETACEKHVKKYETIRTLAEMYDNYYVRKQDEEAFEHAAKKSLGKRDQRRIAWFNGEAVAFIPTISDIYGKVLWREILRCKKETGIEMYMMNAYGYKVCITPENEEQFFRNIDEVTAAFDLCMSLEKDVAPNRIWNSLTTYRAFKNRYAWVWKKRHRVYTETTNMLLGTKEIAAAFPAMRDELRYLSEHPAALAIAVRNAPKQDKTDGIVARLLPPGPYILDMPAKQIDFTSRIWRGLLSCQKEATIGELMQMTHEELIARYEFEPSALEEIEIVLQMYNGEYEKYKQKKEEEISAEERRLRLTMDIDPVICNLKKLKEKIEPTEDVSPIDDAIRMLMQMADDAEI